MKLLYFIKPMRLNIVLQIGGNTLKNISRCMFDPHTTINHTIHYLYNTKYHTDGNLKKKNQKSIVNFEKIKIFILFSICFKSSEYNIEQKKKYNQVWSVFIMIQICFIVLV